MKTIVVASQKGGVGKTTLTGHLSVEAHNAGAGPVVLLDTDPQGSLAGWWNDRSTEDVSYALANVPALREQLAELRSAGAKLVIIDTPPAITGTIQAVINCADLVLIPTRPSPHDLRAIGGTVSMVESAGMRPIFVINGAASRARITTQAAVALSAYGAVCPTIVHQRTDFASSMTDGRTAQELDASCRSADEIRQLWAYVHTQLKKVKP